METNIYSTKTLSIAAFLYASKAVQLVKTERINREVYFYFSPKDIAEQLVDTYFAGTATVNPRELFARLNDLKDLIFSGGKYA